MRYTLLLLALFLLACEKPHPNVEEDIAILQGDIPEPDTTEVVQDDCVFDTSRHRFTIEALASIPGVTNIRWDDSVKVAIADWRGNKIYRLVGGCHHFTNDLSVVYADTTAITNTLYWLPKALTASTQFGIPYYPVALKSSRIEFDSSQSNRLRSVFQADPPDVPENQVLLGISIEDLGDSTRISFQQYTN